MKRLLSLSVFLMMAVLSFAFEVDGIYYNITSSSALYTVEVTYKGTSYSEFSNEYTGDVTIPESVSYGGKTYSVTTIGSNAFSGCSGLKSITIPNSVTSIDDDAFYGCSSLKSITIPNSVTTIGDYAFSGCPGLKSITIPNSVMSIGANAFYGTAWYDNQPNGLVYAGKVAYKYKGTMPKNTVIDLEEGTTGIASKAFYNCSGLTSITIPNSVTSIGDKAFYGCSGLTSITIPNSVTKIGSSAFAFCRGLTSVTIPNSVTSIGSMAFHGCSGLTSITIPNGVTTIGFYTFAFCSGLTSITIPNSVTSIDSSAFDGCGNLVSVEINSNAILSKSYTSSSSLVNIFGNQVQNYIIGNDVRSIGSYAFHNTKLKSVTIGAGVLSIRDYAFSYSDSSTGAEPVKVIWLTNTPPKGYEKVGGMVNYVANDLYKGLSNMTVYPFLSSMFEAGGVKYVPVSPSERTCDAIDCTYDAAAENINIGKTVSYKGIAMTVNNIKPYTCYQNTFIKSADVSYNGSIGDYAFYGCGSLNNVTLSNNGDIGISAFESSKITSTLVVKNTGNIGEDAFRNIWGSYTATISNSGSIGNNAFRGCIGMISATIENRLKGQIYT